MSESDYLLFPVPKPSRTMILAPKPNQVVFLRHFNQTQTGSSCKKKLPKPNETLAEITYTYGQRGNDVKSISMWCYRVWGCWVCFTCFVQFIPSAHFVRNMQGFERLLPHLTLSFLLPKPNQCLRMKVEKEINNTLQHTTVLEQQYQRQS